MDVSKKTADFTEVGLIDEQVQVFANSLTCHSWRKWNDFDVDAIVEEAKNWSGDNAR